MRRVPAYRPLGFYFAGATSPRWWLYTELPANRDRRWILYFAVPRHGGRLVGHTVYKYGMFPALAKKVTALPRKMPQQVYSFQKLLRLSEQLFFRG